MSVRSAAELVRPEVRALAAYRTRKQPCRFKLDANEVPWDLPSALKREFARRLAERDFSRYPDLYGEELAATLSRHTGHPAAGILAGNGSGELLALVLEAVAGAASRVLVPMPSFELYPSLVRRTGAELVALGPRPDLALPLDELEAAIERDPRCAVVLASPNNPTGEAVPAERVGRLAARLDGPLLLDNAYGELCRHDYLPLLAEHPNLIVFRTLSKAWSLAGLRIGYLLAAPELARELVKIKLPYGTGHAATVAAEVATERFDAIERRVRLLIGRREQWSRMLAERGFTVLPSEANFVLVRCPGGRAEEVREALAERGVLVRSFPSAPALAGTLRVTVGDGRALRRVEETLDEIRTREWETR